MASREAAALAGRRIGEHCSGSTRRSTGVGAGGDTTKAEERADLARPHFSGPKYLLGSINPKTHRTSFRLCFELFLLPFPFPTPSLIRIAAANRLGRARFPLRRSCFLAAAAIARRPLSPTPTARPLALSASRVLPNGAAILSSSPPRAGKIDGGGPHQVSPPRRQEMISKLHAKLSSVFPLFKFRFDGPLIQMDFIKSWVVAFLRCTVSLAVVIIIMNWFQAAQPALQYGVSGVIGFVAVHWLWNGEAKQLMGKLWDWNTYGTKLNKFHGWILQAANKVGYGGEDDATALPVDGSSTLSDDHDGLEDHESWGQSAVQLLAIRANFRISAIYACDWVRMRYIYSANMAEEQEEGMVNLVPFGPYGVLEAVGVFGLKVFAPDDCPTIIKGWDVSDHDEVEEYTQTIYAGFGRKMEITYLVMPDAFETSVEVKLNLKDLGSRSRAVYGTIKASSIDYGSNSVHLFSRGRGRSLPFSCGSTCVLPLAPFVIALPHHRRIKLHIEVDLRVITTSHNQEEGKNSYIKKEEGKNLKFCLDFTPRIRRQERQVGGDQVEVNTIWHLER